MSCRDSQKQRVYDWENNLPQGEHVAFADIPAYVNRVWKEEGLNWPPLVETLAPQDKKHDGTANRGVLSFRKNGVKELTVLHEIAHAMTMTIDDCSDSHGPAYVGVYMKLLANHLCIPLPLLLYTATKWGVKFDITTMPWSGK